jgi:hypothetical protein
MGLHLTPFFCRVLSKILQESADSHSRHLVIICNRVSSTQSPKLLSLVILSYRACFDGRGYGNFYDIDMITAFADYR